MATEPVTDDERAAIADAIQTGRSYADIARQFGRGTGTVARIAKSIGWTVEQSTALRTRKANEGRSAYSAEKRAELAAKATERAEQMLAKMEGEYLVFNFGGKDNDYNEHTLEHPPTEALRSMAQTFRDLMRTVLDIDRHDNRAEDGLAAVDQWLRGLVGEEAAA